MSADMAAKLQTREAEVTMNETYRVPLNKRNPNFEKTCHPYRAEAKDEAAKGGYIGSVAFFKQLIIFILLAGFVLFGMGFFSLLGYTKVLKKENSTLLSNIELMRQSARRTPVPSAQSPLYTGGNSFSYQKKYPQLYVALPAAAEEERKKGFVYFTFDDGPSRITEKYLDVLAKHNIKATFFVVGKLINGNEDTLKRIAREGHTIGIHTYSHVYSGIYASVDDYLRDFAMTYDKIYKVTGQKPQIFRFPGGSINAHNRKIYGPLVAEMTRRGFKFYDWNVSASDAVKGATSQSVYSSIVNGVSRKAQNIVLMHDTSHVTLSALERVIASIKSKGLTFESISSSVAPITFY